MIEVRQTEVFYWDILISAVFVVRSKYVLRLLRDKNKTNLKDKSLIHIWCLVIQTIEYFVWTFDFKRTFDFV